MSMSLNQPDRGYEISAVEMPKWKLAISIILPVILILGLCFIFKGVSSCTGVFPDDAPFTTVSPNIGMQGQTLSVVIRDTKIEDHDPLWEDKLENVSFGAGITVINWVKRSSDELVVNISISDGAAPGSREITGTFISGGTFIVTSPDSFTVIAVPAVNPDRGLWGQSLPVIITGTNLMGATAVSFGTGITVDSFTVNSATQITANISIAPGSAIGTRDVLVILPGGTASLAGGFRVIPQIIPAGAGSSSSSASAGTISTPTIIPAAIIVQSASLSADAVTPGMPVTVTADIANKSTVNGSKKVTLYVNGQVETTQGVAVNSGGSSKLTFNVSRSEPGDYTVYVDGVPAGSFKVEMVTGNDGILIFSIALLGIAFVAGLVIFWRRQQHAN